MKKLRRVWVSDMAVTCVEAEMTVDRKKVWKRLSCPLSNSPVDVDYCGEWCAWFDVEMTRGALGVPDREVVTCKGQPIGEIAEGTP
jgi:hypothetical protein